MTWRPASPAPTPPARPRPPQPLTSLVAAAYIALRRHYWSLVASVTLPLCGYHHHRPPCSMRTRCTPRASRGTSEMRAGACWARKLPVKGQAARWGLYPGAVSLPSLLHHVAGATCHASWPGGVACPASSVSSGTAHGATEIPAPLGPVCPMPYSRPCTLRCSSKSWFCVFCVHISHPAISCIRARLWGRLRPRPHASCRVLTLGSQASRSWFAWQPFCHPRRFVCRLTRTPPCPMPCFNARVLSELLIGLLTTAAHSLVARPWKQVGWRRGGGERGVISRVY